MLIDKQTKALLTDLRNEIRKMRRGIADWHPSDPCDKALLEGMLNGYDNVLLLMTATKRNLIYSLGTDYLDRIVEDRSGVTTTTDSVDLEELPYPQKQAR